MCALRYWDTHCSGFQIVELFCPISRQHTVSVFLYKACCMITSVPFCLVSFEVRQAFANLRGARKRF